MESNRRDFFKAMASVVGVAEVKPVEEEKDNPVLMIVVRCDRRVSDDNLRRIKEGVEEAVKKQPLLKDVPVLVVDNGLKIDVIRQHDGDADIRVADDLELYGNAFSVNGRRVDPRNVVVKKI